MTNASNIIFRDKDNGVWVFDDPNDGLAREPFVEGPDRMIHRAVADIPNAASAPGHFLAMGTVGLARDDGCGNWYRSEQSCFIIARDLRSLAPSRASTCKTSWIDRSLF
ncbi:MAG: hypothetical protein WBX77_20890 [Pseudolabrys sp.]